jgi:hypothetical protein
MKKPKTTLISCAALALPILMIGSSPASAEYDYQMLIPPGALSASAFGINNAGMVGGQGFDGVTEFSFTYDMKRGEYVPVGDGFLVYEISNNGVMVGSIGDEICAIRDKSGNVSEFYPPSFGPGSICIGRAVNSNDKVSGFLVDDVGGFLGFVYDIKQGTYEEFLPSFQTIAQGINSPGQNVGSVFLFPGEAYEGSPPGIYAYLREADGATKYFEIAQAFPGESRARGISESGLVAGWYLDPVTFEFRSYVATLSGDAGFETVELAEDQMIHVSPCDPDLPPPPPGYEAFSDVFAQQVRNDGVVVGICQDYIFNPMTFDFIPLNSFGFIATPIK